METHPFTLSGKIAVVTGGTTGIGFGISRGLAAAGAAVAMAGLDGQETAGAVAELKALGVPATFLAVDITEAAACRSMIEAVERGFGRVDILVNNAGIVIRRLPQDYTPAEWQSVIDVNLSGAFYCAQAVYPGMSGRRHGRIINVGSVLGSLASPTTAPYAASKAGIMQLTRALAVAWAGNGITVNAVLPGWIDTAMTRAVREAVPSLGERVLARTPLGRWGRPADLAGVAVFLASRAADFVTGAGIVVDGGYSSLG